jgi:predicted O-linked N-acetylglucosamine transferase (SPINDLY family)
MYPPSTPVEQLEAAKSFCEHHVLPQISLFERFKHVPVRIDKQKIVIGYLSADFHNHATSYLIAELLEQHDRNRFEIIAFSYGPNDRSSLRRRMEHAVRFVDVEKLSTLETVQAIRQLEIDILVDLKGYTKDSRAQIMAHRPAPIQVNYLGYPGSMGAPFMDYVIADAYILPRDQEINFTEKIVYLPDCYQVNDSTRKISSQQLNREEYGLPEQAFVYCSFNANYKISPDIFDVWMRSLRATPSSVLWLLASNKFAPANLCRAAAQRGVDPKRMIFAKPCEHLEHIARHRLADLFLDTFPVNAHTTASDALWAGLPLLTISGQSFISRVAGSLLTTLDLPELITTNLAEYETKALQLQREPARLMQIRAKLEQNRNHASLFNAKRFARKLENAYRQMWAIHCAGESPHSFCVEEDRHE